MMALSHAHARAALATHTLNSGLLASPPPLVPLLHPAPAAAWGAMGLDLTFEGFPFLEAYAAFTVLVYVVHTWLDTRQLKALRRPKPPPELAAVFSDELYKKTQKYQEDK